MPPIRRVRQHVNPLSNKYANPVGAPDWGEVFSNPQLPLHLDIGCGKGDFCGKWRRWCLSGTFWGLRLGSRW